MPKYWGGNKFPPKWVKSRRWRRKEKKKKEEEENRWKQWPASLRPPPRVAHPSTPGPKSSLLFGAKMSAKFPMPYVRNLQPGRFPPFSPLPEWDIDSNKAVPVDCLLKGLALAQTQVQSRNLGPNWVYTPHTHTTTTLNSLIYSTLINHSWLF